MTTLRFSLSKFSLSNLALSKFLLAFCLLLIGLTGGAKAQVATYVPPFNPLTSVVGQTAGSANQPWQQSPNLGPNLWLTPITNLGLNTTSSNIVLTGNSTAQSIKTRFNLNNGGNQNGDKYYRFTLDTSFVGTTGWADIAYEWLDSGGNALSPSTKQYLVSVPTISPLSHFKTFVEFKQPIGGVFLQIYVEAVGNFPAGSTLTLYSASLYRIAQAKAAMNAGWFTTNNSPGPNPLNGYAQIDIPLVDPVTRTQSIIREITGQEGDILASIGAANWIPSTTAYGNNFVSGTGNSVGGAPGMGLTTGSGQFAFHVNNFGQVMAVVKGDGTQEVRCNVHGGEWGATGIVTTLTSPAASSQNTIVTAASLPVGTPLAIGPVTQAGGETGKYVTAVSGTGPYTETLSGNLYSSYASGVFVIGLTTNFGADFTYAFDMGDGVWNSLTDSTCVHQCRRFRMTWNTLVYRSDQSTPFASCAYTWIYYADGTLRCDRTVTLLATQAFQNYFVWMCAYGPTNFMAQGRVVSGQSIVGKVDYRPLLVTPVIASVVTSGTGGLLPASTKSYRLTALTLQGEGSVSAAVSATSTGTTSSNTVTFPSAQTGQTAWRVYDANGLLATLPVATTSYSDTGAVGGAGQPPTVNNAFVTTGTSQYDNATSVVGDYGVYREANSGACFYMGLDHDAISSAIPGVAAIDCRLINAPGITKTYWDLQSSSATSGIISATSGGTDLGVYSYTMPSGTVLTTTTWAGWYAPSDAVNFEKELAARPVKYLPGLYPTN